MSSSVIQKIATLRPVLRQLSKRFTMDSDESSDLIQDTLLKALIHHDKFNENTNLQGWMFTIMRNTFINGYRKNKRQMRIQHPKRELYFFNVQDEHTFSSPERTCVWKDLWKNIEALKDDIRAPFELHTSGYKYHEIAERLNIPVGTVKNRIFQARKELQARLA